MSSLTSSERLSVHILPTSATMVGVCLTSIGLVKLVKQPYGTNLIAEALAITSVVFCVSVVLSYASIRWAGKRRAQRLERVADYVFTAGMLATVSICIAFAFDLA